MRKLAVLILSLLLVFACAAAAEDAPAWTMTESAEMTAEALAAFDKAAEELTDAVYEPVALLAESDGIYCILCRVTRDGAEGGVSYALVYAGENGVQNIWELWIAEHSMPRAE